LSWLIDISRLLGFVEGANFGSLYWFYFILSWGCFSS
jgi:hypothetical protein